MGGALFVESGVSPAVAWGYIILCTKGSQLGGGMILPPKEHLAMSRDTWVVATWGIVASLVSKGQGCY